jgi:hypothetical protein
MIRHRCKCQRAQDWEWPIVTTEILSASSGQFQADVQMLTGTESVIDLGRH